MIFDNATKMAAGYSMSTDKTGRESLVVVVKGTYRMPDRSDQEPQLLAKQAPMVTCDEFNGEPAFSAPIHEMDFAPIKPRCDVLLNGSAHAPVGKPTDRVSVSLHVGSMTKSFDVVGNRTYQFTLGMTTVSSIEPFTAMPISYDNAYGGVDRTCDDPAKHRWYLTNHAGRGYYPTASAKLLHGKPLPNTEERGRSVNDANGKYLPMAFGPLGRAWQQRARWTGTYDQAWLEEKHPFLPDDFDDRYFQASPEDQQIDYLRGGEEVSLTNLTPAGRSDFRLPADLSMPVLFVSTQGEEVLPAVADTIVLQPDARLLTITWRVRRLLRRNPFEIIETVVGRTTEQSRQWKERQRQRRHKRRFATVAEMAAWQRKYHPPRRV